MKYVRQCTECGKEFETTIVNKLTCSHECSEIRHKRVGSDRQHFRSKYRKRLDCSGNEKTFWKKDWTVFGKRPESADTYVVYNKQTGEYDICEIRVNTSIEDEARARGLTYAEVQKERTLAALAKNPHAFRRKINKPYNEK